MSLTRSAEPQQLAFVEFAEPQERPVRENSGPASSVQVVARAELDAEEPNGDALGVAASPDDAQEQDEMGASPGTSASEGALAGEHRVGAVWRQWLSSMATDAEAALAAAIAYRDLDSEGRERWLDSLQMEGEQVDAPAVALYAPLLAVESDLERRTRLLLLLSEADAELPPDSARTCLAAVDATGGRLFVLVLPLYLDFVQVLACRVARGVFDWVRHDPIVSATGAPLHGDLLEGIRLEKTPMRPALDDLAAAVLSHRRSGQSVPEALEVLADLFRPDLA